MNNFDVGIIGAGVAGAFASLRIAKKYKNTKTILFDIGRRPGKRRRQLEGWLGCFPSGDGKLYPGDLDKILEVVDGRKARPAFNWVMDLLKNVNPLIMNKDVMPNKETSLKIKDNNFDIHLNSYIQWRPSSIHQLSRLIANDVEDKNVEFSFDNEVFTIIKKNNKFLVSTEKGDFYCKKIVLCVGRSGWRWVTNLYKKFGIYTNDNIAKYGAVIEMPACQMKSFNKSHCFLEREDINIGPFNWLGSIIPEDHADLVLSAFRSNEDRWKSEKAFFSLSFSKYVENNASHQMDRIAKLSYLLFNDRISREKIKNIMNQTSLLCLLPEYSWLKDKLCEIESFIPNLLSNGYLHVPNILPLAAEIRLGSNLESEIDDMFVAGESARLSGILSAAISGVVAADSACK